MQGKATIFIFDTIMTEKSNCWKVTHVAGEHWFLVEREYLSIDGAVQNLGELVRMPLFGFCFKDCIVPATITRAGLDLHDGVLLSMSFKELEFTEVETERK